MQFKNLRGFQTGGTACRMELSVPLPKTPDGRVYRYSPNERALPRHFVLGDGPTNFAVGADMRKRMKQEPRSPRTVCPYSGVIADDDEFTHPDDIKAARKIVEHAALADVRSDFDRMFRKLTRSSSRFITIKAGPTPPAKPRPRFSRRDLLRELVCDHCGRDYGVFAISLFCPDCGAPNLRLHFALESQIVTQQITLAVAQEGREELAYWLMGNAHEDVLTAFEATLKAVYLYGVDQRSPGAPGPKPVRNDFQNVERAQRRFAELACDPFVSLSADDLATLKLNIQKRHIIGHNLSIMDERFADETGGGRIGETVRLVGEEIQAFAALAQRVVDNLDNWLAGGVSAVKQMPTTPSSNEEGTMKLTSKAQELCGSLGISSLAERLGTWLVTQSQDGLAGAIDDAALSPAFTEIDQDSLRDAIAELKADGYLTTTALMNRAFPRMRATLDLFVTFDPIARLGDPVSDSLVLVDIVLQGDGSVSVPDLHKQTSWGIRRFNPAIGLVIAQVDEDRVSQETQNEYPARYFRLAADDRVALRRYAESRSR